MSYDYKARVVFVSPLATDRHPAYYDLCAQHIRSLAPPRGWKFEGDSRSFATPSAPTPSPTPSKPFAPSVAVASDAKTQRTFASFPPRNRPDAYLRRVV